MSKPSAILLGASGSVGQALVAEATRCGRFREIMVVTRRSLGLATGTGTPVVECVVPDMSPDQLTARVVDCLAAAQGPVVGLSVLGVGAKTAQLTLDEHRAVDVRLNAAFAAGLKASGIVHHLVFMSSG